MNDQKTMPDLIVVLGKRTVRKTEVPHLETFGRAMYARSKQLVTTRTEGVASIVADAYRTAGGTPILMNSTNYASYIQDHPVVVFTDAKYQAHLDATAPDWRDQNWLVIHNPKAIEEAAVFLTQILSDFGTPLEASA